MLVKSKLSASKVNWPQLFLLVLGYYLVLLPMQPQWLPVTLGIMFMGVVWLGQGGVKLKGLNFFSNYIAVFCLLYYVILVLGLFYTTNSHRAGVEIGAKVPLLAWPLLLSSALGLGSIRATKLIMIFAYSTVGAVILCLIYASVAYLAYPHSEVFFFQRFAFFKYVPAHYLGMYVNFAYGVFLLGWLKLPKLMPKKFILLTSFILLALAVVLIAVRMQFIIFMLVNIAAGLVYIKQHGKPLKAAGAVAFMVVLFVVLTFSFKGSRNRIVDTYNELKSFNTPVAYKETNPRFHLWPAAVQVIRNNFWLGTGVGAEKAALNKELESSTALFWDGTKSFHITQKNYNYHNSYLQHFAAQGIFGFLILLALFVGALLKPLPPTIRPLALLFLAISALSFFTESMLQRQAGILFFSFFYAYFFVLPWGDDKEEATGT